MNRLDAFFINNIVVISRASFAKMLGVNTHQIISYESETKYKNPLKRYNLEDGGRKVYYDLMYAIDWYRNNINHSKSSSNKYVSLSRDVDNIMADDIDDDLKKAFSLSNLDPLEKIIKLEDAKKRKLENKIKEGEYIHKDSMSFVMLEYLKSLKDFSKRIEDNVPKMLSDKYNIKTNEIKIYINKYFLKIYNDLREKIEKIEYE